MLQQRVESAVDELDTLMIWELNSGRDDGGSRKKDRRADSVEREDRRRTKEEGAWIMHGAPQSCMRASEHCLGQIVSCIFAALTA